MAQCEQVYDDVLQVAAYALAKSASKECDGKKAETNRLNKLKECRQDDLLRKTIVQVVVENPTPDPTDKNVDWCKAYVNRHVPDLRMTLH